jgi:two-component system, OmpR family, sensor histidine kinase KdpD
MTEERPAPESFLDLVAEKRKGRLKIYVGAAAGVGKTWRMLEEAHELRDKGVDVVLGFVETHGRADTVAKLGDLEAVTRRKLDYRGVPMEEMDVDAILARRPEVAVVDELAHTNVAGSKHEKRYQDIEELLAAGINVITAMNIQHVESLNPMIKRLTGVDVRETVPDSFLVRADQIVNVDITVEALRERLREGKVYPPAQIEHALKNFFKPTNLASLREVALREVARGLSRQREDRETLHREGGRRTQPSERVMVGLSSNARDSGKLLRKACRIAGQLGADWYAVHVETPSEAVSRISTRDFVKLLDNINLADDLGAEPVWLKSEDVADTMLEFARTHGVTKIVLGRSRKPLWRRLLRADVTKRLLSAATDFDVEVVGGDADEPDKEP